MNQRLELRQGQSLVMTQQLQQSIKLLQLSTQELAAFIAEELEQNPLLTRDETENQGETDSELAVEGEEGQNRVDLSDIHDTAALTSGKVSVTDDTSPMDSNFDTVWQDGTASSAVYDGDTLGRSYSNLSSQHYDRADQNTLEQSAPELTLKEHVMQQIYVEISDPVTRMIALHLTDMLDDNGYIASDMTAIQQTLGCRPEQIDEALAVLQTLDPVGIFARSLSECLALQLKDKNRYDPAMAILLENLEILAKGDRASLKRTCQVSEEDLLEMIQEIKALNPKPGSAFASEVVHTVQPDVFLKKNAEGGWLLELNNDILPKLLINRQYKSQIERHAKSKDDKKYLSEQLNTANWLIKALDQRAQTILRVATEIVAQQDEFFCKGIAHLKPMTLASIAETLDMHESTVSRVTSNKYIATPMGMFELKYFFSSSLGNSQGGELYSSRTVKYLIKDLIDKEEPRKILSDDIIAAILQSKGIDVARRTVAKYREALGIPSSVERRKEKRLGGK